MKNTRKFWNKIAKNYDSQVESKYSETYDDTIEITKKHLKTTDVVLDYGCGTGITTVELEENVRKIYAIDISENMISIARDEAGKKGISNVEFDAEDIYNERVSKGSPFDVIMAFNVLYFLTDIDNVLKRIHDLPKPAGKFISSTDCLGEMNPFINAIQSFLSKIGLIPYMRQLKISELKRIIEENKFSIIETHSLYDSPPNYYIVARKNEK